MKKSLAILGLCAALSVPAALADSVEEQAADYRAGLMEVMGWNLKQMGAMLKGKVPMDATVFSRRARDLNAAAHMDILAGFPEDSVTEDSDAKDEIWLDWENFTAKLDAMREKSEALAQASTGDSQAAIKEAFGALAKACKSCHKAFRK